MSKEFRRGLVVGKFAPLHRGHELIIRRAQECCQEVYLLSYSNPEFPGCEPERRTQWLADLFPKTHRLVLNASAVPPNDADDKTHRRFVGRLCLQLWGVQIDAVFTSEDYGSGFAQELTTYFREHDLPGPPVQHVCVDPARLAIPVSGSAIRQDVHGNRQWLAPEVYASFVQRICLLGGESSGKSTLVEALAQEFKTVYVHEYGRILWGRRWGELQFADMTQIAERQIALEEACARRAQRFLFCDTSPLTTLFYSRELFGRADPALETLAGRPYDLTVLCAPDFPFVQDGTRGYAAFRDRQHAWYLDQLRARQIPWIMATGTLRERVAQIARMLAVQRR